MKITGYCPTFNRPHLLARMIKCWEQQTHSDRELIIVDDAAQLDNQKSVEGKWEIISLPRRIRSLGEKNNVCMSLASFDSLGYLKVDDDDCIMPWAVEAVAEALTRGELVQPRHAIDWVNNEWVVTETHAKRTGNQTSVDLSFAYHGCWAQKRSFYEMMRGYAAEFSGDDQELDRRRRAMKIHSVGIDQTRYKPFYWYYTNYFKAHPEALLGAPLGISRRGGSKEAYMDTPTGPYVGKLPKYEGPAVWDYPIPTKLIPRQW